MPVEVYTVDGQAETALAVSGSSNRCADSPNFPAAGSGLLEDKAPEEYVEKSRTQVQRNKKIVGLLIIQLRFILCGVKILLNFKL